MRGSRFGASKIKKYYCFSLTQTGSTPTTLAVTNNPVLTANWTAAPTQFLAINTPCGSLGINGRVGDSIVVTKIQFRAHIYYGSQLSCCRLMFIYDDRPQGTTMLLTDIFEDANPIQFNMLAYNNLVRNRGRFKVLFDRMFCVPNNAQNPQGFRMIDINLKTKCQTQFIGSSNSPWGQVNDIAHGAIYCLIFSDKAAGVCPSIGMSTGRIRYTDN